METTGRDVAMDAGGNPRTFSDWFDYCAQEGGFTDSQLAKAYAKLWRLKKKQHQNGRTTSPPQTRIKKWRTGKGKPPGAAVAYRIGRALQELGLPVSGLEALIAGHHLVDLLGTIGSHISIGVASSKPVFHPMAPEIAHVLAMLDKLVPRISRELTIRKMQLGIRALDIEEFAVLQAPLPEDELYPKEQTPSMDAGFLAWTYDEANAFQKLPPSFAAAIALVKNPTPEVVELAAKHLAHLHADIMSLLDLGTPRWVLRACGDHDESEQTAAVEIPEPDYTMFNNFFDEYESIFSLGGTIPGCRRSMQYPHVNVKLCGSEYHDPGTAADIDFLVVDETYRGQGIDKTTVAYFQTLAGKHGLALVTWPADNADEQLYRGCGFKPCQHPVIGLGRRLECPDCAHTTKPI